MTRISRERLAALAGVAFVALYVATFGLGIEVGASDREILDRYADSGNRAKEVVAFFLIAAGALAFIVFAASLRGLIARAEQESAMLAALTWAGGTACACSYSPATPSRALRRSLRCPTSSSSIRTRGGSSRTSASCSP